MSDDIDWPARVSALEKQLQEERAGAAAMREALVELHEASRRVSGYLKADALRLMAMRKKAHKVLTATPVGREFDERFERYEAAPKQIGDGACADYESGGCDAACKDLARRALGDDK